jgi:hypothetical protein
MTAISIALSVEDDDGLTVDPPTNDAVTVRRKFPQNRTAVSAAPVGAIFTFLVG